MKQHVIKFSLCVSFETVEKDQQNRTMRQESSTTGPPVKAVTEPGGRGKCFK